MSKQNILILDITGQQRQKGLTWHKLMPQAQQQHSPSVCECGESVPDVELTLGHHLPARSTATPLDH